MPAPYDVGRGLHPGRDRVRHGVVVYVSNVEQSKGGRCLLEEVKMLWCCKRETTGNADSVLLRRCGCGALHDGDQIVR